MTYAIVYSSQTGNTRFLAETLAKALPAEDRLYVGVIDARALSAERIYLGFWTDKGTCDAASAEFLTKLTRQELFLFGTCGFGGDAAYFSRILENVALRIPQGVHVVGRFLCQGRMPQSVRARYVKMAEDPGKAALMARMIENFDRAQKHPNADDGAALLEAVRRTLL